MEPGKSAESEKVWESPMIRAADLAQATGLSPYLLERLYAEALWRPPKDPENGRRGTGVWYEICRLPATAQGYVRMWRQWQREQRKRKEGGRP